MKLTLKKTTEFAPTRIVCTDNLGAELATVLCDGDTIFTHSTICKAELKEILVIAENFNLFKTNLQKD